MILYQILNQETGEKLYHAHRGEAKWGNAGAYWKKPDTIKKHLEHLLYAYEVVPDKYADNYYWRSYRKTEFNTELAKRVKIIATEMQTIGASRVLPIESFMEKEVIG